jgi:hypothetical protein
LTKIGPLSGSLDVFHIEEWADFAQRIRNKPAPSTHNLVKHACFDFVESRLSFARSSATAQLPEAAFLLKCLGEQLY